MRTDCSPNLDIKLRPPVQEASKAGNIFITFEIQRMTVGVYWDVITIPPLKRVSKDDKK